MGLFENVMDYADTDVARSLIPVAMRKIASGEVSVLAFSGKKGSGKDTIAAGVSELIQSRDGITFKQYAFANSLKEEAGAIITTIDGVLHEGRLSDDATEVVSKTYDIPSEQSRFIVDLMDPVLGEGQSVPTGWTRSQEVWTLLRYLGTEVRQPQDQYYWVKKALSQVLRAAAFGENALITDVRFPHEAGPCREIGAFLTRIDISPKAQVRRLQGRDGLAPSPEALAHNSETLMDSYPDFDCWVDNSVDGESQKAVEEAYATWKKFRNLSA